MDKFPINQMFKAQKELMVLYQKIEGLPDFPIDLHTKAGQKVIRDFTHRLTEELAEAHASLLTCYILATTNQPEECAKTLKQHNLEIADAMHFLLELIIFTGYDEQLDRVFRALDNHSMANLIKEGNPLKTMLDIGAYMNFTEGLNNRGIANYNIVPETTYEDVDTFNLGNKRVSADIVETEAKMLWYVVCNLHLITNELKSKEWTQGDKTLNLVRFERAMGEMLISFGQYLDYGQFTQIGLRHYYLMKNAINLDRIKSGY